MKGQPTAQEAKQIVQHILKRTLACLQLGDVLNKLAVAVLVPCQRRVWP